MDLLHFVIYHQPWTRGRKPLFLIIRTILKWPAFMRVPLHGDMFSVPWGIRSRRMVVTFNILQDLPDGALKQMHILQSHQQRKSAPLFFPQVSPGLPCSLCGRRVLCFVFFFFYDSHITGNGALSHAVLSPSNL